MWWLLKKTKIEFTLNLKNLVTALWDKTKICYKLIFMFLIKKRKVIILCTDEGSWMLPKLQFATCLIVYWRSKRCFPLLMLEMLRIYPIHLKFFQNFFQVPNFKCSKLNIYYIWKTFNAMKFRKFLPHSKHVANRAWHGYYSYFVYRAT